MRRDLRCGVRIAIQGGPTARARVRVDAMRRVARAVQMWCSNPRVRQGMKCPQAHRWPLLVRREHRGGRASQRTAMRNYSVNDGTRPCITEAQVGVWTVRVAKVRAQCRIGQGRHMQYNRSAQRMGRYLTKWCISNSSMQALSKTSAGRGSGPDVLIGWPHGVCREQRQ